jgi:hypothetical protein
MSIQTKIIYIKQILGFNQECDLRNCVYILYRQDILTKNEFSKLQLLVNGHTMEKEHILYIHLLYSIIKNKNF